MVELGIYSPSAAGGRLRIGIGLRCCAKVLILSETRRAYGGVSVAADVSEYFGCES
jgi:hypothetical protein